MIGLGWIASFLLGDGYKWNHLQLLVREVKHYAWLQRDYVRLLLVEKLTRLMSFLVLTLAIGLLAMMVLFYIAFAFACFLAPHVGGFAMGFSIVSVGILLLALLLVVFRNRLIVRPLMSFLTRLFMND